MITGTRGPGDIGSNQVKRDVATRIYLQDPTAAPFTALLSQLAKRKATSSKIEWYSDVLNPSWDAINNAAGYAAGDTSIVVDNGAYFNVYDLVKVPRTGEVLLVTAVSTNTLTVVRGYGTTSAAALVDNDPLLLLGPAMEDGLTTAPTAKSTQQVLVTNQLQEFTLSVEITKRLANSDVYGEADRAYQRRKKAIEVSRMIERAFLFGEPLDDSGAKDSSLSKHRHTTGGLLYYLTSNVTDIAGAMSETAFEEALRQVFTHGSNSRMMLASPLVNSVISTWARGKLQTNPEDQVYGVSVARYISPHGTVKIVEEKMLEGDVYGGYAILLDLKEGDIFYRYLQNCDMTLKTDIHNKQSHSLLDEYTGILGLQVGNESLHGIIKGITGAA
jgi:hypothetical protein